MALLPPDVIQISAFFLICIVTDQAQHPDCLIFNIDTRCLLDIANQGRVKFLTGLLELIQGAALRTVA